MFVVTAREFVVTAHEFVVTAHELVVTARMFVGQPAILAEEHGAQLVF